MKNVLTPIAKTFLIPLGERAAASATDGPIQKKIYGPDMTILRVSNKEMKDILEIIKYLEESGLLNKCVTKKL